jgi:hypothetical protein
MNVDLELALSILAQDPTAPVPWSVIITAFNDKVSTSRTINGKSLLTDIILDLDSVDFINQGTTTTLLHGNAAGAPSWGGVVTNDITNSNVTLAKVQDISTSRFLGRITAGTGVTEQLTGTQATSLLDLFATAATTKGLVPGSNSVGVTYFLRADATWAVPPSSAHASLSQLSYATAGHTGFEPTITAGTSAQYYRGDKTWQTLAAAVTAADILAKLLTVDGTGSLLDADLLDGHESTYFEIGGTMTAHLAAFTHANIANGQTAFGWGNHAGLYRPVAWMPSYSDVGALAAGGTAVDSDKVDGQHAAAFLAVGGTATAASTITIVNDVATNANMYPTWVTTNTGNLPLKVSSTKIWFNPSTGALYCSGEITAFAV